MMKIQRIFADKYIDSANVREGINIKITDRLGCQQFYILMGL